MSRQSNPDDEGQESEFYRKALISSIRDAGFLVLWVAISWLASRTIGLFELSDSDKTLFGVFQILFAASTIVPIAAHIIRNIAVIVIRTWRSIRNEARKKR